MATKKTAAKKTVSEQEPHLGTGAAGDPKEPALRTSPDLPTPLPMAAADAQADEAQTKKDAK